MPHDCTRQVRSAAAFHAIVPAGDVELKHLLWTLQQQWGASTGAWLEAPFFELDVVDMTEQVCGRACVPMFPSCWFMLHHVAHGEGNRNVPLHTAVSFQCLHVVAERLSTALLPVPTACVLPGVCWKILQFYFYAVNDITMASQIQNHAPICQ
jgi:hypothetical protein